ncbi:hypothetical protein N431DRAFT_436145 [Stipitochalara longipes BDJ]|nr:hypothetical protein N431DRAFT_436145 [Stipitochalara longipes BDJ]
MRGIGTAFLGIFTTPLLARALPPTPPVLLSVIVPQGLGTLLEGANPVISAPIAATTITTSLVSTSASPQMVTTTKTIDVVSFITSKTSSSTGTFSSAVVPTSTSPAVQSPSTSLSISAIPMASRNSKEGFPHRTLVIVLSSVLGFLGLTLLVGALFMLYRYRRRQSPFCHSPINDEEIQSWRRNTMDQKRPPPAHLAAERPEIRSLTLGSPPGWTWAASPTSIQTVISPVSEFCDSPSFLAKAPNSRIGLTDETVPGADPFVGKVKRQSSRLSKAPPGHVRTKSRRSSTSAKSMGSFKWQNRDRISGDSRVDGSNFSWFDPEDESVVSQLRTDRTSSSNGASLFDGLAMGGLSPRPQPRQDGGHMYIGRAIG